MMEELKTAYQSYQEYKAALDTELQQTAESFVRIGYLLRVAVDTDILQESEYDNVNDFARAEYGIDRTQVSRFISINNRFSENGYSDRLKDGYRGIGYAKLSLMLTLPDSINEELTPDYSKTEIQAIKEEYETEREKTDIEVMLEGEHPGQQVLDNNLTKALYQLLHDQPALYMELCRIDNFAKSNEMRMGAVDMQDLLAPQGTAMYSVRLQGIGRMMLSIKSIDDPITLISLRDDSKEQYDWQQAVDYLNGLADVRKAGMMGEDAWEQIYNEPYPVEDQPAPEEKPEPRKQSKVTKAPAKPVKKEPKPAKQLNAEEIAPVQQDLPGQQAQELPEADILPAGAAGEEQLPGQESIETLEDGKYMPEPEEPQQADATIDGEKVDADITETRGTTECDRQSVKEMAREAGGIIRNINNALHFSDYNLFEEQARELLTLAEKLRRAQEEED